MLSSAATLPTSGSGYYHQHDALGNVVALTNAASYAVLETYTYDPFGKRTVYNATGQQIPDTAYANTHGYTGREHLPLRDLMDYRNRTYSTTLGRFLQTDPIRFRAGDVNLYRYVFNNPVIYTDAYGLSPYFGPCPDGKIMDDAGACCCPSEIVTITIESSHRGLTGHTWLNLPSGTVGHHPGAGNPTANPFAWNDDSRSGPGDTKRPDPTARQFPDASTSYNACPESLNALENSLTSHTDDPYSLSNQPARNCTGWACERPQDAGFIPPLNPSDFQIRPSHHR